MREIVELKQRIQELEEQNSANLELLSGLRVQLEMVSSEGRILKKIFFFVNCLSWLMF